MAADRTLQAFFNKVICFTKDKPDDLEAFGGIPKKSQSQGLSLKSIIDLFVLQTAKQIITSTFINLTYFKSMK